MAKPKCRCKAAECEECPEWIFTFADLVMLMMGFFVILWVLKPYPGKDGEAQPTLPIETRAIFKDQFGFAPDPNSNDPVDVYLRGLHMRKPMGRDIQGKTANEQQGVKGTEPEVEMIRKSIAVGTGTRVLFDGADDKLTPDAMRSLDTLANLIRGHTNIYMVKGHTSADDYPDSSDESQKMALSLRRAQAAADYLVTKGVDRMTLRVQGCSTFEPVILRAYTGDARMLNRRVEVESTGTPVKQLQGSPKTKPATPEKSEAPSEH